MDAHVTLGFLGHPSPPEEPRCPRHLGVPLGVPERNTGTSPRADSERPELGPRVTLCSPSPVVTFPEDLHCAKVTIVSEEQCRRIYPGSITPNMVCAGEPRNRADSCQVGACFGHLGPLWSFGTPQWCWDENGHISVQPAAPRGDLGARGGR